MIRKYRSNDPAVGYNRWPKFTPRGIMMQYQDSRQIRSPSSMLFRIAINVANDLGRAEQARGM